jgi:DNA gyrase inhibitor GyrI
LTDLSAVLELARIPKYAVVMVPIAAKALDKTEAITALLVFAEPANLTRAKIAASAIATSPPTTTNRPVQARVLSTCSSETGIGV